MIPKWLLVVEKRPIVMCIVRLERITFLNSECNRWTLSGVSRRSAVWRLHSGLPRGLPLLFGVAIEYPEVRCVAEWHGAEETSQSAPEPIQSVYR